MDAGGKSPLLVVVVSFLLGALGALAHIAYSFLPALNAADVVVFGAIGTLALEQGVGVGHVYSFVTIPLGLALGAILARRFSAHRVPRETNGRGV